MDEAKLIHRLQCRRRYALDQAIEQFTPYVGAVIWRILAPSAAGREDVEEAVSDVFLALWAHAEELDPERGLRPWLGAVARNKAKKRLRQAGRYLPLEEDALEIPGPDDPPGEYERAVERQLVRQAVDSLPDPDREVFLRHYFYAQTVAEVARRMELNESTVKTKLRRGRMKLKEVLTREGFAIEA